MACSNCLRPWGVKLRIWVMTLERSETGIDELEVLDDLKEN